MSPFNGFRHVSPTATKSVYIKKCRMRPHVIFRKNAPRYQTNWQTTGKRYEIADAQGLSVRVSPLGLVSFQYRFRFQGKTQRLDLGNYPLIGLAEAREAHFKARKLLDQNINPIDAKKQAIRSEAEGETVTQLTEDFVRRKLRRDHKCPEQAEQILNANVIPYLGSSKVKDVRRRDVVAIIEKIVDRGANTMANRTTSLVKQMFKFAVMKGLIESNPCGELTRTSIGGPEKPRDSYLTYRNIWTLWHELEKVGCSESLKLSLKILLATGQRRGELMKGQWKHINFERRLWTIPAELSKNGKPHIIHLAA